MTTTVDKTLYETIWNSGYKTIVLVAFTTPLAILKVMLARKTECEQGV